MAAEWSPHEDLRPGKAWVRKQPELTPLGYQWTWIISFRSVELKPRETDIGCFQQFQIRDCSGQFITTEGRIYSPPIAAESDEDGA